MRVQTEEWRRFIPGVRMYKGKQTLFYNGEILYDALNDEPLIYNKDERHGIEVIIVLPGVEIISRHAFGGMQSIKTVIMADTVKRIEDHAFQWCDNLAFVKLSRNLEHIGPAAFFDCGSLTSIFIPPACVEIGSCAFERCFKLLIFNAYNHTQLRKWTLKDTALVEKSANVDEYRRTGDNRIIAWVKSINVDDEYGLHRLCSSMDPSVVEIYRMICEQGGLHAMAKKNGIGISPSDYLASNPYADVDEMKLIKRFVLEKMGEVV